MAGANSLPLETVNVAEPATRTSPHWFDTRAAGSPQRAWALGPPLLSSLAHADVAQLVEHNLAKVGVAGSNPVVRSIGDR